MAVLLGVDLGQKRIGIAYTDEEGRIAFPHSVILYTSRKHVVAELEKIIREYKPEKIVVGLPTMLKGGEGLAAERVREQVEFFQSAVPLPWIFWDERMSTREIDRMLISADVSRERRKEVRDQLAAQRILQNYIDYHSNK